MFKMDLKLKSDLSVTENLNSSRKDDDMTGNLLELIRIKEQSEIRNEIKNFIDYIGHLPCDNIKIIQFFDDLLLSGHHEDFWKNFASHLGFSTDDLWMIENKCRLEKSSEIMEKIVKFFKKKFITPLTWKLILESLLTEDRFDILLQLLEKKFLFDSPKLLGDNYQEETFGTPLHAHYQMGEQSLRRSPVEVDDRETSFRENNMESEHLKNVGLQSKDSQGLRNENVNEVANRERSNEFKQHKNYQCGIFNSGHVDLQLQSNNNQENEKVLLTPEFFSLPSHMNSVHCKNFKGFESFGYNNSSGNDSLIHNRMNNNSGFSSVHDQENNIKLFLTYASDAKQQVREIKKELKTCYRVLTVNRIKKATNTNLSDAIQDAVKKAHLVLVLLSRKYINDINELNPKSENVAYTRMIFDIYRNRYVNNGCYNTDVRVLRLPGVSFSDTKELVSCLQNPFEYPYAFKDFINNLELALRDKENQEREINSS